MAEEKHKKRDAEEVKEILEVVSQKVPELLNQLADVLYGAEQSQKYGKAVAQFYKELKAAGMSSEEAYELTKQYMSIFSLGGAIGKMMGGGGPGGAGDEIGDEIKKKIKLEIRKGMDEEE